MTDPIDLGQLMTDAMSDVGPTPPPLTCLDAIRRKRHRHRLMAGALAAAVLLSGTGWAFLGRQPGTGHQNVRINPTGTATTSVPAITVLAPKSKLILPPGAIVIPNLVGLSTAQAQRTLPPSMADDIAVGDEVVDQSVQPGTVVAQTPQAGSTAAFVTITIAVPPTIACTQNQLAVTYKGGGAGAGNDFGTIAVRDISPLWCSLSGPLSVVGLDRTGRPVTQTVTVAVTQPFILSPNTPAPPHGQRAPFSDIEANVLLAAEYRDGPQPNGLCDTKQVIPAYWQVTFPTHAELKVVNDDPDDTADPNFQRLITCQGQMDTTDPVHLPIP
jgi:hypothetical protein